MVTGASKVFGLVGHPIRRSLSPAMHNKLFKLKGVDAVYVAFDVLPSQASKVANAIRTLDLAGCNLTVPFKAAILSELDEVRRGTVMDYIDNYDQVILTAPDEKLLVKNPKFNGKIFFVKNGEIIAVSILEIRVRLFFYKLYLYPYFFLNPHQL